MKPHVEWDPPRFDLELGFLFFVFPEPAQGFLVEADTRVEVRVTGGHTDLNFTLSRSLIHCARWQKPQFGPSLLSSSLTSDDSQTGGRVASLAETEGDGDGEESSWEERSILSRLTVHCSLASFETQEAGRVQEWGGAWQGKVEVGGVDVAISTAEIEVRSPLPPPPSVPSTHRTVSLSLPLQLLLALAHPFSAATPVGASAPASSHPATTPPAPPATATPFLPNGTCHTPPRVATQNRHSSSFSGCIGGQAP